MIVAAFQKRVDAGAPVKFDMAMRHMRSIGACLPVGGMMSTPHRPQSNGGHEIHKLWSEATLCSCCLRWHAS